MVHAIQVSTKEGSRSLTDTISKSLLFRLFRSIEGEFSMPLDETRYILESILQSAFSGSRYAPLALLLTKALPPPVRVRT